MAERAAASWSFPASSTYRPFTSPSGRYGRPSLSARSLPTAPFAPRSGPVRMRLTSSALSPGLTRGYGGQPPYPRWTDIS